MAAKRLTDAMRAAIGAIDRPSRFVLVLPAPLYDAHRADAERMYPGVDIIRQRPVPTVVSKDSPPCP